MAEQIEWDALASGGDSRPADALSRRAFTTGPWQDEDETRQAFVESAKADPRFSSVYEEVEGRYVAQMPHDKVRDPRIDVVLIPSTDLRTAGWCHGAIGVEVKAPGKRVGPAAAQCIDYTRATFNVMNGFYMPLSMVFLFECGVVGGDLESVMVQNRVGTCRMAGNRTLRFFRGGSEVVSLERPDRNRIPFRKVGSR